MENVLLIESGPVDITSSKWTHQRHGARFLRLAYDVWEARGVQCMIIARISNLLLVLFGYFIVLVVAGGPVDMSALQAHLREPECLDGRPNNASLFTTDCRGNLPISLARLKHLSKIWTTLTILVGFAWLVAAISFIRKLPSLVRMAQFYREVLGIHDVTQHTWADVVRALVVAQRKHCFYNLNTELLTVQDMEFDASFIANCLTRKDNYYVALYTHDIIKTNIFGMRYLPHSLHWCIDRCLTAVLFQDGGPGLNNCVDDEHMTQSLVRMYRMMGAITLILAPGILVYRLALYVFRYADDLRAGPQSTITTRHWSNLAMFQLRDYCEVPALLHHRLALSYKPALDYASMFPVPVLVTLAQFITMITGGIIATLLIGSVVFDEHFLKANLSATRTVSWWLAIMIIVTLVVKSYIPAEYTAFVPAEKLREIALHVHYYPPEWQTRANKAETHRSFCRLFPYRFVTFIEEIMSAIVTPVMLMFVLPTSARQTVRFVCDHSTYIPTIGHVCTMASFGQPYTVYPTSSDVGSSLCAHDGQIRAKMEASRINFTRYYHNQ